MTQFKFRKGQTVMIHNAEWFKINYINGRYTMKGRYEYADKIIKAIAGRGAKIFQYHEDIDMYDILIGNTIYQVEPLFFNIPNRYYYDR